MIDTSTIFLPSSTGAVVRASGVSMATSWVVSTRASVDRYSPEADVARYRAVTDRSVVDAVRLLNSNGHVMLLTIPDPDAPDEGIIVQQEEVAR